MVFEVDKQLFPRPWPILSNATPLHTRLYVNVQPNVNFVFCPDAIMSSVAHRRPLDQAWIGKQEAQPDEI